MTDKDKEEIANLVIKKLLNTRTQLSRDLDKMDDILSEVLGAQLTEEERWKVVLYVQALQNYSNE
jgi:hypothetical protein